MALPRPFIAGMALAATLIALDQATKTWLKSLLLDPPRTIEVTSFFTLLPAWNRGVSFSLFADHDGWGAYVFTGLAVVVSIVLARWMWRGGEPHLIAALGCIIGGALGNAIDRVRDGAVFDFLYFHYGAYGFPAFNVADSAITVGVVLLLWDSLFVRRESAK